MTKFKLGRAYTDQGRHVAEHWSRLAVTYEGGIGALQKSGISPDQIAVDDLHALDMLHMGGLASTDELAKLAGIAADQIVLDVGSGVGGPARRIASKFGASVLGAGIERAPSRDGREIYRTRWLARTSPFQARQRPGNTV
jgi:hypothetical protein